MKALSGILFVAGTCIGSGMIALPIALAKIGLIPSIIVMLCIWIIVYHTAIISLELNLQAGRGLALGDLCKMFSGNKARIIGDLSLKSLSYILLTAYIDGGSSVIKELMPNYNIDIKLWYVIAIGTLLTLPSRLVQSINNILFISLISIIGILVFCLILTVNWMHIPLFGDKWHDISTLCSILPLVFTSFGFQVIFHTLTDHYDRDAKILNRVFLFGSFIPAVIYIIWNCSVLGAIYENAPDFYFKMSSERVVVGELVKQLALITKITTIQLLIWWIAILAITTSVIGVGIGLANAIEHQLTNIIKNSLMRQYLSVIATVLPGYLVVICIPNIFIRALSFAGMILAIIAIILPIFLLKLVQDRDLNYPIQKNNTLLYISFFIGILIIICEIFNII
jgi:tyrosine-specific transport protein